MTMSKQLRIGDKVEWKSHGTNVSGKVEQKITSDTEAAGKPESLDTSS